MPIDRNAGGPDLIEPTDDERRNGWTAKTLTAYLAQQRQAQSARIDPNSEINRKPRRPGRANSKYRPFRWTG